MGTLALVMWLWMVGQQHENVVTVPSNICTAKYIADCPPAYDPNRGGGGEMSPEQFNELMAGQQPQTVWGCDWQESCMWRVTEVHAPEHLGPTPDLVDVLAIPNPLTFETVCDWNVPCRTKSNRQWTCSDRTRILLHDEQTPPKYWCHKVEN